MALAWLRELYGDDALKKPLPFLDDIAEGRREMVLEAAAKGVNAPPTSSMGRLFDAVAALAGLRNFINYEGQAAYITEAFKAFASHRDALLGIFFYRWEDQETCWACGEPDCMVETAWGLVDLQGRAKPSLQAFKEGAAMLCG